MLDLACGEGIYARQFKRAGASVVTGVDVSQEMIALAEAAFWDDFMEQSPLTATGNISRRLVGHES